MSSWGKGWVSRGKVGPLLCAGSPVGYANMYFSPLGFVDCSTYLGRLAILPFGIFDCGVGVLKVEGVARLCNYIHV